VFITQVCAQRYPWLAADSMRDQVLSVTREVARERNVSLEGWVVLPDHFHLIVTTNDGDVSSFMRSLKLRVLRRSRGAFRGREAGLWQPRFHDHVCRDVQDFERHLDYLHFNPVKHGHVRTPTEWAWSSFAHHVREGAYPMDWASSSQPPGIADIDRE